MRIGVCLYSNATESTKLQFIGGNEEIQGFTVETPKAGNVLESHILQIRGWIVGRHQVVQEVRAIHLIDNRNSALLSLAEVNIPRDDVAAHYPSLPHAGFSGFRLNLSLIGLPEEIRVCLRGVLADGLRVNLAVLEIKRRARLNSPYQPRFQPLMITSLGRSGSTWLMHLLAQHPNIVAQRQYPYEVNTGKYLLHNVFKSLSEPLNYLHPEAFDGPFKINQDWVGASLDMPSLFQEWAGSAYIEQVAAFCQQSIDSFYTLAATRQSQNSLPGQAYFAEKYSPNYYPHIFSELYPQAREVLLVRDFRDMLCSMHAFTKSRGVQSFGLKDVNQDEEIVEQVKLRVDAFLTYWQNKRDHAYLLRYEDLMQNPLGQLEALLAHLGLAHEETLREEMLTQASEDTRDMKQHRTSGKPKNSVGRWRRDLTKATASNFSYRVVQLT